MSAGYERFENELGSVPANPPGVPAYPPSVATNPPSVATYPPQYDGKDGVPIQQYPAQQDPVQYPSQQPPGYVHQGAPNVQVPGQQTIIHTTAVPAPPDYLCFAVFVTICCCLPLGIVAIIKSSEVRSRAAMGDTAGALQASAEAKKFSWIGFVIGGISVLAVIIYVAVAFGIAASSCDYC